MTPAVPFALAGVVQLLAVAGWLGLGAASAFPRLVRRTTLVFAAGVIVLAVADALTATRLGTVESDRLGLLRAAGLALAAIGLAGRVLQPPRLSSASVPVAAVTLPLALRPAPAGVAAGAGALAVIGAVIGGRGRDRVLTALLAGSFGLAGAATAVGAGAKHSTAAAATVLGLRAGSGVLALAVPAVLGRSSLLAKVVTAILAGVVASAAAAVGVVGTGLASDVRQQQESQLTALGRGQIAALDTVQTQAALLARVTAQPSCRLTATGQRQCGQLLDESAVWPAYFAAEIGSRGDAVQLPTTSYVLTAAQLRALEGEPVIRSALRAKVGATGATFTVLSGARPALIVLAASRETPGAPRGTGSHVGVYAVVVDDAYLRQVAAQIGRDVSVFGADGQLLATSLPPGGRAGLEAAVARVGVGRAGVPTGGRTVEAIGSAPTVHVEPVFATQNGEFPVGALAVSLSAHTALQAERDALTRLFLTTLAVLVVFGLLALAVGQRVVDPVRRLTVAAGRVRRGDLDATSDVQGRDEVGALSRAFNAMTASLRGMTQDLRETAAAESTVRTRLEAVLASMSDGLVATDGRRLITSVNPAAADLLAVPGEALVGRPLVDALPVATDDGKPLLTSATRRLDASGTLTRADGTTVPVDVALSPLEADGGVVVVVRDTSREREIERMKTEFLANVSHELRTPLTPIRGYAEILRRRSNLPVADVARYLDEILHSTARMHRVVELLVDVAALEAGRVSPVRQPTAIGEFVDGCLETWRARWPERADDFKRRVAAGLPRVDVDPEWTGKALAEFADNAVKYSPPGSPIQLTAALAPEGGGVRLSVRDNGPGIAADDLPLVLSDFAQVDASETRRVGGLGLGLSFVSRLARQLGTPLVVTSTPGKGSEFGLDVPIAAGAVPAARRPRAGSVRSGSRRRGVS